MNFVDSFQSLNPRHKKLIAVSGAMVSVIGVSFLLSSLSPNQKTQRSNIEQPEVSLVEPLKTMGIESFAATLQAIQKDLDELRKMQGQIDQIAEKQKTIENSIKATETSAQDQEYRDIDQGSSPAVAPLPFESLNEPQDPDSIQYISPDDEIEQVPPQSPDWSPVASSTPYMPTPIPAPSQAYQNPESPVRPETASEGLRIISEAGDISEQNDVFSTVQVGSNNDEKNTKVYIPSGSMFTGVLLNGLDATTSSAAQKNPMPVVLRVKREAVLPNYAAIDVRECFVLAAGYGQLATERAIMRAESMSCVRTDGQVFESKLNAYIVGSDGKVGLPGRLISKHGQLIAQSLMAGMLSGIGDAFTETEIPSLNISPTEGILYESQNASTVLQNSLTSGVSSAANQVASFYLKMAEETFPVVEVPAGEVATIIMTTGTSLPLKGSSELKLYADRATTSTHAESSPVDPHSGRFEAPPLSPPDRQVSNPQSTFSNGAGW